MLVQSYISSQAQAFVSFFVLCAMVLHQILSSLQIIVHSLIETCGFSEPGSIHGHCVIYLLGHHS